MILLKLVNTICPSFPLNKPQNKGLDGLALTSQIVKELQSLLEVGDIQEGEVFQPDFHAIIDEICNVRLFVGVYYLCNVLFCKVSYLLACGQSGQNWLIMQFEIVLSQLVSAVLLLLKVY